MKQGSDPSEGMQWVSLGDILSVYLRFEAVGQAVSSRLPLSPDEYEQRTLSQQILAANLRKGMNSLRSTAILCGYGMVADAYTVCRKLIELSVSMTFMMSDPEKRAKQYWDYSQTLKQKCLKKLQRFGEMESSPLKQEFKQVQKEYSEVKSAGSSWSGKSILDMAKDVDVGRHLTPAYLMCCMKTHAGADDLIPYLQITQENKTDREQEAKAVLYYALDCYWQLMRLVNESFQLNMQSKLEALAEDLGRWSQGPGRFMSQLAADDNSADGNAV